MRFEINFVGTKDILYTQSEQLRGVAEEYLTRLAKNGMAAVVYIYSKPAPQAPNFWYGRQPLSTENQPNRVYAQPKIIRTQHE